MAELIISREKTIPVRIHKIIHSTDEMLNNIPIVTTKMVTAACIRALCSSLNNILKPLSAYLNDTIRLRTENFSFLFSSIHIINITVQN